MNEDGEVTGELTQQRQRVQTHRRGHERDEALVPDLVAVAERAVDDRATPVLGQAGQVGELVAQAGRGDDPAGVDHMPTTECDTEAAVLAGHVDGATGEHLGAVGAHLLARDQQEVRGRATLVAEVAVHLVGGRVPGLAGVDDDHRPTLAGELQGRGEARGGTADDGHFNVSLDDGRGAVVVGSHDVHRRPLWRILHNFLHYSQDRIERDP